MKLDWSPKKGQGNPLYPSDSDHSGGLYLFLQDPSGVQGLLGWIWGIARPFVVGFIIAYLLWRPCGCWKSRSSGSTAVPAGI